MNLCATIRTPFRITAGTQRHVLVRMLPAVVVLCAGAPPVASAAPILPSATTLAHCAVNSSTLDQPSSCSLGVLDTASASLTLTPFVGLFASASAPSGPGSHGAAATAIVQYFFQVVGGSPGDVVPLMIATSLSAIGTDPSLGIGFAALNIHTTASGDSAIAVCSDGHCGASSFSGTVGTQARVGDTTNTIGLQVQASVVGNSLFGESASARADPFIFIDPRFPTANLYSIVVSPGVANAAASPVPEPTSAVLVLTGLSLMTRKRELRRLGLSAGRRLRATPRSRSASEDAWSPGLPNSRS